MNLGLYFAAQFSKKFSDVSTNKDSEICNKIANFCLFFKYFNCELLRVPQNGYF